MKKNSTILKSAMMLICALLFVQFGIAQRTTIAGWTFPSGPGKVNTYPADCPDGTTATLYLDGTHGSDEWLISGASSTKDSATFYMSGKVATTSLCNDSEAGMTLGLVGNGNNGKSVVFTCATTGLQNIQLSYNLKRNSSGYTTASWSHSTDGVNFTTDTIITYPSNTNWASINVDFSNATDINDAAEVYFKLTVSGATTNQGNNRYDNIHITGEADVPSTATAPPFFSVAGGNYCGDVDVEITCATTGASIYYTLDGTDPDNVNGTLYSTPIHISTTDTLRAIAYAEGLTASTITEAIYTFPSTVVSTIAEFKALEIAENVEVKLNCPVTAVFKSTNNNFFVEDAAHTGLCIYGNISTSYVNGDVISGGICGTRKNFYGLIEIQNPRFGNPTPTSGTAVEPVPVTMANLLANWQTYDSRLVTISGVTFEQGSYASNAGTNVCKEVYQGLDTLDCANTFKSLNSFTLPAGTANITGLFFNNTSTHKRIAPRSTSDIETQAPSITIVSPTEGQVIEQGDPIRVSLDIENFNFEDNSMIEGKVFYGEQLLGTRYIHSEAELTAFEAMDLSTLVEMPFGAYAITASFVNADSTQFEPVISATVNFTYSAAVVSLEVSESSLSFTAVGQNRTFDVTGHHLDSVITLTVDNSAFTVSPATMANTVENGTVTVTFTGSESTTGTLTLTSDTITVTVALNAIISNDEIIYSTGFEVAEGFNMASATDFYNHTPRNFGPDTMQWSVIHGRINNGQSNQIVGSQYMQIRCYGSNNTGANTSQHMGHTGYTYTNFDLSNVTKVEFSAKTNYEGMEIRASYSTDGGENYTGDSTFAVSSSAMRFTYFISEEGQYDNVRVKFTMIMPVDTPTSNADLFIDSVDVYGITGIVSNTVATPVLSQTTGTYLNPISVSITCATDGARIYYTTNGTVPDTNSTLYENAINIDSTCTLKAKAFKDGMNPSSVATATYTFPVAVANIAAFKAAGALNDSLTYAITGDVTFVYRKDRRIFIEDATGGLLVYDNTNPVITGTYNEGDVIHGGIVGTYTVYNGMQELVPTVDWAAASGTAAVTPVVATAANIINEFATYEARLVRINAGTFAEDITFTTSSYSDDTLNDGTGEVLVRNQFKTLDTTINAGDTVDVIGLASIYVNNGITTYQIFPRTNADIMAHVADTTNPDDTVNIHTMEFVNLTVYPNPTTAEITVTTDRNGGSLEVLNAFGQVVYRSTNPVYPMTVNLNDKAAGLYFVRIITDDQRIAVVKVSKR